MRAEEKAVTVSEHSRISDFWGKKGVNVAMYARSGGECYCVCFCKFLEIIFKIIPEPDTFYRLRETRLKS